MCCYYITNINVLEKVNFNNLEDLCLRRNNISNIDILEKVNFKKLKRLDLSRNKISDINVFEKAIKLNQFENLEYLDLSFMIIYFMTLLLLNF